MTGDYQFHATLLGTGCPVVSPRRYGAGTLVGLTAGVRRHYPGPVVVGKGLMSYDLLTGHFSQHQVHFSV